MMWLSKGISFMHFPLVWEEKQNDTCHLLISRALSEDFLLRNL